MVLALSLRRYRLRRSLQVIVTKALPQQRRVDSLSLDLLTLLTPVKLLLFKLNVRCA